MGNPGSYLRAGAQEGFVILAGRTQEPPPVAYGIVVFEANDPESARRFMESDPTVPDGVMTFEFHPYQAAAFQ